MKRSTVFSLVIVALAAGAPAVPACGSVVVIEENAGATSAAVTAGGPGATGAGGGPGVGASTTASVGGNGGSGGAAVSVTGAGGAGGAVETPGADEVVTYQIDAAHTGYQPNDTLTPPLTQRWSLDLGGSISYPLIAGGRVFVTVSNKPMGGSRLFALDQKTGAMLWGPVDFKAFAGGSHATYAGGRLFVQTTTALLCAFDATTGDQVWCVQLKKQGLRSAPPTAFGSLVYVSGAELMVAVSQATGQVVWSSPVKTGLISAPTVSSNGVYCSYGCNNIYDFAPATGATLWKAPADSFCDTGRTPILFEGVLYARTIVPYPSTALDATTGAVLGGFTADRSPAFHAGRGFFPTDNVLTARAVPSLAEAWSFTAAKTISVAPLVVNGHVYVGDDSGQVSALDEQSGALVWSTSVGAGFFWMDHTPQDDPLPGLAAGGGALIVPVNHHLLAYW